LAYWFLSKTPYGSLHARTTVRSCKYNRTNCSGGKHPEQENIKSLGFKKRQLDKYNVRGKGLP
jgi:hypothetical protein